MSEQNLLEASGISMSFGPTKALDNVSLHVAPGECLGIVGRNGAGKSTIVSILTGLRKSETGTVRFLGQDAPLGGNPAAWQEYVSCVYQHSMLVPTLTVAENIFLNRPMRGAGGALDWRGMRRAARQVMTDWNFDVDVDALASDITVEQRQIVEIARALAMGAKCLILDEPTAALERGAVERLFARLRPLMASGVGIIYISHHFDEVFELCDRVIILRDGKHVVTAPTSSMNEEQMITAMVGDQAVAHHRPQMSVTDTADQPVRLGVSGLSAATAHGRVERLDLEVRGGECVGLLGLRGAGTTVIADVIAGLEIPKSGTIRIDGKALKFGSPAAARDAGVGYVPGDRHARGYVPLLGVGENITMSIVGRFVRGGILSPKRRNASAAELAKRLDVKSAGTAQPVGELSGGNQQKVVVGRALASDPGVVVAVGPTQGVDVASKASLMGSLDQARRDGAAVLLVSDDLSDLEYATRIVVLVRGKIFTEFTQGPWDSEALIAASEGIGADAASVSPSKEH
ncbi:sugar ABC transporter ATP-binding protein [Arthrobacter sp. 92]|uniref:sugar ABC transporter ATP-binding protein n=1 Tax=Arthrobacter sp. 92 TaxID=3418175 RepID=UPI003D07338A